MISAVFVGLFHEEAFVPELPKSGGTVAF